MNQIPNIEETHNTRKGCRHCEVAAEQGVTHIHNTREIDAIMKEVQADLDHGNFNRICGNETLLKHYVRNKLVSLQQTLHHQLQKAHQEWLREEIVRLERIKIKESHIGIGGLYTSQVQMEVNQALQTIIDRYQAELDQDKV